MSARDWRVDLIEAGEQIESRFPECPHPWCREEWHGLAITERMQQMRYVGVVDPGYRYVDDDSTVLCPGSLFTGEFTPPVRPASRANHVPRDALIQVLIREFADVRAAIAAERLNMFGDPDSGRPVRSFARFVLDPPDSGLPWWRCDRPLYLVLEAERRNRSMDYMWGDGEMTIRALLETGGPLEWRSGGDGRQIRWWDWVAVRYATQPPPAEHWQRWETGLIHGETFTNLVETAYVMPVADEVMYRQRDVAIEKLTRHFGHEVRRKLHVHIDPDDVVVAISGQNRMTLQWRVEARWRPATNAAELLGGRLGGGIVDAAQDVLRVDDEQLVYGRAGWNTDTRRWVYMPIDPDYHNQGQR